MALEHLVNKTPYESKGTSQIYLPRNKPTPFSYLLNPLKIGALATVLYTATACTPTTPNKFIRFLNTPSSVTAEQTFNVTWESQNVQDPTVDINVVYTGPDSNQQQRINLADDIANDGSEEQLIVPQGVFNTRTDITNYREAPITGARLEIIADQDNLSSQSNSFTINPQQVFDCPPQGPYFTSATGSWPYPSPSVNQTATIKETYRPEVNAMYCTGNTGLEGLLNLLGTDEAIFSDTFFKELLGGGNTDPVSNTFVGNSIVYFLFDPPYTGELRAIASREINEIKRTIREVVNLLGIPAELYIVPSQIGREESISGLSNNVFTITLTSRGDPEGDPNISNGTFTFYNFSFYKNDLPVNGVIGGYTAFTVVSGAENIINPIARQEIFETLVANNDVGPKITNSVFFNPVDPYLEGLTPYDVGGLLGVLNSPPNSTLQQVKSILPQGVTREP